MVHVVLMKCLIGLPLLLAFMKDPDLEVLKIEESESEVLKIVESESELLCTDSTALTLIFAPKQDLDTYSHAVHVSPKRSPWAA
jgi:hypothetical protein